jgi:hypothetical protein
MNAFGEVSPKINLIYPDFALRIIRMRNIRALSTKIGAITGIRSSAK